MKGRFEAVFTLGSKSLAVLREESRSVPEFPWRHHATLRRLR